MPTNALDALSGVPNACEALPNILTGGQPSAEQLAQFKAAGGALVLDIRDPMEQRSFDEPKRAAELGLEYVNVPISPGATSDEKMERILDALREHEDETIFFHCGSGNRVGGAMLAYLMLDRQVPEDDAVERAMAMGLRSPEYLQWGLDYAHRHPNQS
ncbi:MAG TPA: sulfur transferase domain-containing protein [Gemmatimonadales bacterium]|nr:sulfur transferase domain-containing protein [Gemmatimonadales bacterium]